MESEDIPAPPKLDASTTKAIVETPPKKKGTGTPKSGAPSLDEWQDFIGRIVLRSLTDAYLSMVLRDIEEDLTPRERESIRLTVEDLKEMSAPIASLVSKSSKARKHGRAIIAAADSSEAVIALMIWMRRVNKLAKKYRKPAQKPVQGFVVTEEMSRGNGHPGTYDEQGSGQQQFPGPYGGIFNPGTG